MVSSSQMNEIIQRALEEDIGSGDVTSEAIIPPDAKMQAQIVAKQAGVVAGLDVAKAVFLMVDENFEFTAQISEGQLVESSQVLAQVAGPARAMLVAERVALNFLGRISGIATFTRQFVDAVAGTGTTILDTRKTAWGRPKSPDGFIRYDPD
jgi:nicotinate-nucleotide pyrophosphorylase (carboxylating)